MVIPDTSENSSQVLASSMVKSASHLTFENGVVLLIVVMSTHCTAILVGIWDYRIKRVIVVGLHLVVLVLGESHNLCNIT